MADVEDHAVHAAGKAGAGRQRDERSRSRGTTSQGWTRPRRSCARSSTSFVTASASSGSARACPRAILLHGPPGTGKTLLAKAIASESGANFYASSASAFVEMFAGLGAARIRRLFAEARKNAPAIVFIDELDAAGSVRQGGGGYNREHDQTLNQLLVELDGFGGRDDVIVMGASNRLQDLDPALLRPGRFDRQVLVGAPGSQGARGDPARSHALEAARRGHRFLADRASDGRPDRSGSRKPRQRGGDPGGRQGITKIRRERVRGSHGARRRRSADAARRHRQGEADPRLPRGVATRSCPI